MVTDFSLALKVKPAEIHVRAINVKHRDNRHMRSLLNLNIAWSESQEKTLLLKPSIPFILQYFQLELF